MSEANTILDDKRTIKSIFWDDLAGSNFITGDGGVTKIEVYGEPGLHCDLPYLAIWKGDEILCRVSANKVTIYYDTEKENVNKYK